MTTQRPIRILELRSVRGTGGGPEKTILLGTARTDSAAYAITVCYIRDQRDEVFHIDRRADGLPIDYVEIREKHSLDTGIWAPLRDLVRDRRIDIVHAHEYKTDLLAFLLAKAAPVIPLATSHGWTGHSARELRVYYPADRWLLARFPRVIAVSSEIKRTLERSGADASRVTVVLNGIDPVAFHRDPARRDEARARFGLDPGDIVIGAVGRLEPQKNFPLLLRAFARLAPEFPRARLVIGGDGSLKGELEALVAASPATDRCRLLGHVSDIALLHHALDALVQSSDYEGTPNAVLEAMAFETPLVATDVGGTAELARDGQEGLIVPPRDENALVDAMRRLLADPDGARDRAVAGRRRVEGPLSFGARMANVEAVYDDLMSRYGAVRDGVKVGDQRHA
jgi:glycosyltransferase involved in cell wall biosynthesis